MVSQTCTIHDSCSMCEGRIAQCSGTFMIDHRMLCTTTIQVYTREGELQLEIADYLTPENYCTSFHQNECEGGNRMCREWSRGGLAVEPRMGGEDWPCTECSSVT